MSTFEPPPYPPAGWYQDPEHPRQHRWWDGRTWAPSLPTPPVDGLREVGEMLSAGVRRVRARWRALGVIALLSMVPSALAQALGWQVAFAGVEIVDNEVVGWTSDRIAPVLLLLGVAIAGGLVSTLAIPLLMLEDHDRVSDPAEAVTSRRATASEWRVGLDAAVHSLRIVPRFLGWTLLVGLVALVAFAVVGLLAVATGPGVLLLVLPLVPFGLWAGLKLAFVTIAVVDRPGTPFRRSGSVSNGRFWAVFGRVTLIGLIGMGVGLASNSVGSTNGVPNDRFGWVVEESTDAPAQFSADLGRAFRVDPGRLVASIAGSVVNTVLGGGFFAATFARLYRTRNPARAERRVGP